LYRRYSRVIMKDCAGRIEYLSDRDAPRDCMPPHDYDRELGIHIAVNSWMVPADIGILFGPSEMGLCGRQNKAYKPGLRQVGEHRSWSQSGICPMEPGPRKVKAGTDLGLARSNTDCLVIDGNLELFSGPQVSTPMMSRVLGVARAICTTAAWKGFEARETSKRFSGGNRCVSWSCYK